MKAKIHLILSLIWLLLILIPIRNSQAQEQKPSSYFDFGAGFFQVKDEKNYGLVFNGGMLNTSYLLRRHSGNHLFNYKVDFGFGPSFAKGIAGINFKLNPVKIDYCFRLAGNSSFSLYLGPYAGINYQFQLYPELQSGHMLWFTFYDLEPRLILKAEPWEQQFRFSFAAALVGLVSRSVEMNEVYYYSLNVFEIIGNMHSHFKAGSLNVMNHIDFETEWKIPGSP